MMASSVEMVAVGAGVPPTSSLHAALAGPSNRARTRRTKTRGAGLPFIVCLVSEGSLFGFADYHDAVVSGVFPSILEVVSHFHHEVDSQAADGAVT